MTETMIVRPPLACTREGCVKGRVDLVKKGEVVMKDGKPVQTNCELCRGNGFTPAGRRPDGVLLERPTKVRRNEHWNAQVESGEVVKV